MGLATRRPHMWHTIQQIATPTADPIRSIPRPDDGGAAPGSGTTYTTNTYVMTAHARLTTGSTRLIRRMTCSARAAVSVSPAEAGCADPRQQAETCAKRAPGRRGRRPVRAGAPSNAERGNPVTPGVGSTATAPPPFACPRTVAHPWLAQCERGHPTGLSWSSTPVKL